MQPIRSDLWETAVEHPAPGLTTHAYLLVREGGNVLFYSTGLESEYDALERLGGVAWQLLSHRDEAGPALARIRARFGARLGAHARERADVAVHCEPDLLFEARAILFPDVEVIPAPGHSPGSVCYLVDSRYGGRYLFTGDTLYLDRNGVWRAGFIPGYSTAEDRVVLAETLDMLRGLAPDLVVGSAFDGRVGYQAMARGAWPEHVARARAALLNMGGREGVA
ncbi:MAG: MBL fold metallo-hydrolase [Rhodocyclaceae bacterium]